MIVLLAFAFVAGAGTGVTPCVLPILPALLSAGASGGRRRPFGIALGLVATFTFTIVAVASALRSLGLPATLLHTLAIVFLVAFGVLLLVPALADRIEAPLSRLARFGPRGRGDGFVSGLGVGAALGLVAAPCAGPILGAVISVSATRGTSVQLAAVGLAFASGFGLVLLALALGGRAALRRLRGRRARGPWTQRALGAVVLATALLVATGADVRFENALANHVPAFLVDPTRSLENSAAAQRRLVDLRGAARFARAAPHQSAPRGRLPDAGRAPDFTGTQRWFNTRGRALSLASLRGRVVLVDFWTYTCINCLRTLPFLEALDARYRPDGLTIVGVHTPEFSFEHDAANVASAITRNHLRYPVVQDNAYATWQAYGNQAWPADFLIDARGHVRFANVGEGGDHATEQAIRALLVEAGHTRLGADARHPPDVVSRLATPETYLGSARAQGWVPGDTLTPGTRVYARPARLPLSRFAYSGRWQVSRERATALAHAAIDVHFQARNVYLVLSPPPSGRPARIRVLLDGRPIAPAAAGADVRGGAVTVTGQRLYQLVGLRSLGQGRLTLEVPPGVSGYAFTFG